MIKLQVLSKGKKERKKERRKERKKERKKEMLCENSTHRSRDI